MGHSQSHSHSHSHSHSQSHSSLPGSLSVSIPRSSPARPSFDSISSSQSLDHLRLNGPSTGKKPFRKAERQMLRQTFNDLASRSVTGKFIDKETFLKFFFSLPGLLGERLFFLFSEGNNTETIDFDQFLSGIAVYSRGSTEEKIKFIFRLYDLKGEGKIGKSELETMLNAFITVLEEWEEVDNEVESGDSARSGDRVSAMVDAAIKLAEADPNRDPSEATLQLYSFAKWIQQFPEVLEILDLAFADKIDAFANYYHQGGNNTTGARESIDYSTSAPLNPLTPLPQPSGLNFTDPSPYPVKSAASLQQFTFTNPSTRRSSLGISHRHSESNSSHGRLIICPSCDAQIWIRFCYSCGGKIKFDETNKDKESQESSESSILCDCSGPLFGGKLRYCVSCGFDYRESGKKVEPSLFHSGRGWAKQRLPVLEGPLMKVGQRFKTIITRYFVLKDNVLYSYDKSTDVTPSHVLFLEGCFVEPLNHEEKNSKLKYGIEIILNEEPKKSKFLYCQSQESRQQWIEAIRLHSNVHKVEDFYDFKEELGVGRFSSVRIAVSKSTGKEYAVKIIDKSEIDEKQREALRSEVAILKLLHHPNIVKLKNVFETRQNMYLIMNLVKGGDLFDRIVKRKRYPESAAQALMKNLLSVVQYLHSRGIIHRDLKPENVLLFSPSSSPPSLLEDTNIAIADFGLSRFAAASSKLTLQCGTLSYVSPEVLNNSGYGREVDCWSCGIICYLLLRGVLPFDGDDRDEIVQKTLKGKVAFDHPIWNEISDEAKDLIQGLLKVDPKERLSAEKALQHAWFKKELAANDPNQGKPAANLEVSGSASAPSAPSSASP